MLLPSPCDRSILRWDSLIFDKLARLAKPRVSIHARCRATTWHSTVTLLINGATAWAHSPYFTLTFMTTRETSTLSKSSDWHLKCFIDIAFFPSTLYFPSGVNLVSERLASVTLLAYYSINSVQISFIYKHFF